MTDGAVSSYCDQEWLMLSTDISWLSIVLTKVLSSAKEILFCAYLIYRDLNTEQYVPVAGGGQ